MIRVRKNAMLCVLRKVSYMLCIVLHIMVSLFRWAAVIFAVAVAVCFINPHPKNQSYIIDLLHLCLIYEDGYNNSLRFGTSRLII